MAPEVSILTAAYLHPTPTNVTRGLLALIQFLIPNYNQQEAIFLDLFISTDALHVSGGSTAHHREHITVHTASGTVNQYCCLL